jgi:hypothetical protein
MIAPSLIPIILGESQNNADHCEARLALFDGLQNNLTARNVGHVQGISRAEEALGGWWGGG